VLQGVEGCWEHLRIFADGILGGPGNIWAAMTDICYIRGMDKKLTWQEIEQQYNQEWVQLIDYEWPEGEPFPSGGVVRVHAPDRKDFYRKVRETPQRPSDSAFVFVGTHPRTAGVVYNNFHKVLP
jgi:hypothetical protein